MRSLVEQLDQPRSANDDRAAGETLQLRVVWLLDGLPEGQGKAPTAGLVSPEVVDALKELGFENPKVLSQQNTTITVQQESAGEFEFSVPAVIQNWGWRFVGHGNVHRTGPDHFNVAFNLAIEKFSGVGNKMVQEVKLSGATNMPLRHYTVIGMTTVVALRPEEDELQQHLSAFVVYLDRAREFPAEGAESADGR